MSKVRQMNSRGRGKELTRVDVEGFRHGQSPLLLYETE
jgi:hypothetical protein